MRFNILLEDGGVYQNATVLTGRGIAQTKRDIVCAIKYEGGICICNKFFQNKLIKSKDVYEVEEIPKKKVIIMEIQDEVENEEDFEEDFEEIEIPESTREFKPNKK